MIAAHDPEFRHAGVCAIPTRQATEEHDQPQVLLNNDAADDDSPTLPPSSLSSSSGFLSSQRVVDPSADIATAKDCVRKKIYDLDGLSSLIRYSGSRYHDQEVEAFAGMDELDNNMTSQPSNVAALIVSRKYPQADESLRNRLSEFLLQRLCLSHYVPKNHLSLLRSLQVLQIPRLRLQDSTFSQYPRWIATACLNVPIATYCVQLKSRLGNTGGDHFLPPLYCGAASV